MRWRTKEGDGMEPMAKLELTFFGDDAFGADVKALRDALIASEPVERFGKQWQIYQMDREMMPPMRTVVLLHMLHS